MVAGALLVSAIETGWCSTFVPLTATDAAAPRITNDTDLLAHHYAGRGISKVSRAMISRYALAAWNNAGKPCQEKNNIIWSKVNPPTMT